MTPLHRAWTDGVIQGLREYAWIGVDGIVRVGNQAKGGVTTLTDAIARAESVWADEKNEGDVHVWCKHCRALVLFDGSKDGLCSRCLSEEVPE